MRAVADLEEQLTAEHGPGDRAIAAVTGWAGSKIAMVIHGVWFGAWITAHMAAGFDDHFAVLTLVVSLEAIFLAMFVLNVQARSDEVADHREHLDLQVNLLAEQESTATLRLAAAIAEQLNVPVGDEVCDLVRRVTPAEISVEMDQEADQHQS